MPRFFFDLVRESVRVFDEVGIELRPEELQSTMIDQLLQELWQEQESADWSGWAIEILNEAGAVLFKIKLNVLC